MGKPAEHHTIEVSVLEHQKTGMLLAVSPGMKGLMVAGRSTEQIEADLPHAICEMLAAEGRKVVSPTTLSRHMQPGSFWNRSWTADTLIEAA